MTGNVVRGRPALGFINANNRIGSTTSVFVGDVSADKECKTGALFH